MSAPVSISFTIDLTAPSPPVTQSPPDRTIVTSDTVEVRGVAEPGSIVAMVFGGGFEAQADPVTGKFVFGGIKLQPGDNIFIFTAKDRAGNVSGATSYTLILSAGGVPSANVTLDRGKYTQNEVVFITSTIQNSTPSDTFADLTARVSVVNHQGVALFKDETPIPSLRPGQVFEFQTQWETASNPRGYYSVRLEVTKGGQLLCTATAGFEIFSLSLHAVSALDPPGLMICGLLVGAAGLTVLYRKRRVRRPNR